MIPTAFDITPLLPRAALLPAAPRDAAAPSLRTVEVSPSVLATGDFVRSLPDGRIVIQDGPHQISGRPLKRFSKLLASAVLALGLGTGLIGASAQAQDLINVSYDPTRELYRAYNELFTEYWTGLGNPAPRIENTHGGSGSQARAVIDGLNAQVVTLALASDIDPIAATGKLPADWQARLPHNSSPYTSTIVFLVREGNPKNLKDWGDLIADGVEVITPNPKTSGGARWNYLAAWAWAEKNGQDPKEFVTKLFQHVPVLDTGARGSTTTFVQREVGDVLLAWENEAFLALDELGEDQFDIVVPSLSILAEPPVAVIDANQKDDAQRALSQAYLEHLYSPEAQKLIWEHYYRGWDRSLVDAEILAKFPDVELVTIADFGGWSKAQPEHFGEGGTFDQIYTTK